MSLIPARHVFRTSSKGQEGLGPSPVWPPRKAWGCCWTRGGGSQAGPRQIPQVWALSSWTTRPPGRSAGGRLQPTPGVTSLGAQAPRHIHTGGKGTGRAGPATNPTRPCLLRAKRSTCLKVKSSVFLTSGQKEGGWGTTLSVMWMSLSVKTTRGLADRAYRQKAQA